MPRCSNRKLYAPGLDGTWHAVVPRSGLCAYLRTADGQVVRVKGAAQVRRLAGGKDGEAVVIAAAEPPDPAMFDTAAPVAVREAYGTGQVKREAWTMKERELHDRLVGGDPGATQQLQSATSVRLRPHADLPRFGIGVDPDDEASYPAGTLPSGVSGSLAVAAVHAPLPDPHTAWGVGRRGVDTAAATAVLALRQAGVPVAKSGQIMRRVGLIADAVESRMLHRPGNRELDALLLTRDERFRPDQHQVSAEVDIIMWWLLGRDSEIDEFERHARTLDAASNWQDDTAASRLDDMLAGRRLWTKVGRWRVWRTLLESAAAADQDMVDRMFGEDAEGWRKAVRWAAGLPVAWGEPDTGTAEACLFALMEGRPDGAPRIDTALTAFGTRALDQTRSLDGFSQQREASAKVLYGPASPEAYRALAPERAAMTRRALAYEQDPDVVEATLSLLPPDNAIEVAPSWAIGRVAASIAARIEDDPFADGINAALYEASWRWKDATSDDDTNGEHTPVRLCPDGLQSIADLMVDGLAAQAGGQGSDVLMHSLGDMVPKQVPSMLGDRDDATATAAANAVLHHRAYASLKGRDRLHLLATPAGRRAFDDLTADEQDGLYDRIAEGIVRNDRDTDLPDWWGSLPNRVQVAVGGRITVADVFAGDDTKQCVWAAAAAAGLDGDPADPDTHPEWADLLGDTPGGHKVALLATSFAERGDAYETPVRQILDLAGLASLSNRPV